MNDTKLTGNSIRVIDTSYGQDSCETGITDTGVRRAKQPVPSTTDMEEEYQRIYKEYLRLYPDGSNNIPRLLHVATVQSTSGGCVSYFGRFFNAVVDVFSKNAKDDHFLDLMTKVTKAMGQPSSDISKQLPDVNPHLDKSLYFFPGCDY
ncbi:uncharacterized protein LOC143452038 [Clavelina lepadiformis]|uniref:uncharacterized protein LOC143452038 n=1 Tax=Clavelina lepadiformis TaxID=159417 RepID=UPI004042AF33